jgi:GH35 family endo-1,4-beta-xylanase
MKTIVRHQAAAGIIRGWMAVGVFLLAARGSARGADFDDKLSPAEIDKRIAQYRTAEATVSVVGADGKPLANVAVVVRQTRHKFLFGCNAFMINTADGDPQQQAYQNEFAELLNFATLPFYWGAYERAEGRPDAERLRMMARWCAANGIRTKGHPLCWQQVAPQWLNSRSLEEVQKLQLARIGREVSGFAGVIMTWDVVNEAVSMPDFKAEKTPIPALCAKLGRVELIKQTFAAARAANPTATLILNDYDTSPKYETLIRECLEAGVSIDVVGIQSHMHGGYWGAQKTWDVCERFSKLGKPLNFTETTIISGEPKKNQRWNGPAYDDWLTTAEGEERQARQVAEFYTVLFSHPAVQAITWWDFSDNAWLGAPAGLVRKDMSPKPAYLALKKLIKEQWWTGELKLKTDAAGKVKFRGFLGDYVLECSAGKAGFALQHAGQCEAMANLVGQ